MDKYSNYYGIDISKDVFEVMDDKWNHKQYPNNPVGFKQFKKQLQSSSCCVMEATGVYHSSRGVLLQPLKMTIRQMTKQVKKLEAELIGLIEGNEPEMYARLQTIPGIGKSIAAQLIVMSDGFQKFESAKQFTCFIGLSPVEKRSVSSVRGVSRISKQGNGTLRNLLFLCSFNACKHNKSCRELYKRITGKGKSKKLALIAVANKLLKHKHLLSSNQARLMIPATGA